MHCQKRIQENKLEWKTSTPHWNTMRNDYMPPPNKKIGEKNAKETNFLAFLSLYEVSFEKKNVG